MHARCNYLSELGVSRLSKMEFPGCFNAVFKDSGESGLKVS